MSVNAIIRFLMFHIHNIPGIIYLAHNIPGLYTRPLPVVISIYGSNITSMGFSLHDWDMESTSGMGYAFYI